MKRPIVAGLVLAGGRGSRLGAGMPKPLVPLGGRAMIAHVLERFPAWIAPLAIAAGNARAFAAFGLPVLPDRIPDFQGPVAGLDAGAAFLRTAQPRATHLLTAPADTPFLPADFAERMVALAGPRPALAFRAGRVQPTLALWPIEAVERAADYLASGTDRSLMGFIASCEFAKVVFDDVSGDPFFNVNTKADLDKARSILDL